MRRTRIGLFSMLVTAAVVIGGCTDSNDAGGGSKPAAGGDAVTTTQVNRASATAPAATLDAATKTACTALSKDVKTNETKVAKAERIGPPAGYLAVSAQYSAGSAGFYAHMIGANPTVGAAAENVATAMSDLANTWNNNPRAKPSKAALNAAVKKLTAACTPT